MLNNDNDGDKNQTSIDAVNSKITKIKDAIVDAVEKGEPSSSVAPRKDYDAYLTKQRISNKVTAIPNFYGNGPKELNQFLEKLKQVYDTCGVEGKYEAHFIEDAKGALGEHIYASLRTSGKTINTFDAFKTWLCETFDSQLTSFQLLGAAFDATYDKSKQFITFAQKVEKEIRTARDLIKADHKRKHNQEMTTDQVFDLVGGMLMVNQLQANHRPIYNAMVNQMNDLRTASDVATKAECLRDRFNGDSLPSNDEAFYSGARNSQKSSKGKGQESEVQKLRDEFRTQFSEMTKAIASLKGNTGNNAGPKPSGSSTKRPYPRGKNAGKDNKKPRKEDNKSGEHQNAYAGYTSPPMPLPLSLDDIMGTPDFQ